MTSPAYPVASLSDQELQDVKALEQKLKAAGQEKILIAYTRS